MQIGHRKSIDLYLFGTITADEYEILKQLASIGQTTILKKSENISIYLIDGIKVGNKERLYRLVFFTEAI